MGQLVKRVKGVRDILPDETPAWRYIENIIATVMAAHGYGEIRTPAFEPTELFVRGVGAGTDIVNKEMYTFTDLGGKSLTLKPELTAPVVRAYLQNNLNREAPLTRLYYLDALYRQERPQKGRLRQFHQFGAEALGSAHPEQDVEIMAIAYQICRQVTGAPITLRLNTVGSDECREPYLQKLRAALQPHRAQLAETEQARLDKNALRLFDSKSPETQALLDEHAPMISDHITAADKAHFQAVRDGLRALDIPFRHEPKLVRGLDYYTRTTFEITSPELGAQDALCGGGRYDNLVEELGGKSIPAVGFAAGIERLIIAAGDGLDAATTGAPAQVYFAVLDPAAATTALKLADDLRKTGLQVVLETLRRSTKAQLREANRTGVRFTLILGPDELTRGVCQVRDMTTGDQQEVEFAELPAALSR